MIKVDFINENSSAIESTIVVIVARYHGKWVLVRHKERSTYEVPGGHIEANEDYIMAAKRELYEESGATEFSLNLVSFYTVTISGKTTAGYLFFANITKFLKLPDYEIAEISMFECLPKNLTYPQIQPYLFDRVQAWLNLQSAKDEIWDVYDKDRQLTGRTHRRGDPLLKGDYHLVVHVWIQNNKGEFLITKRTSNKGYPNMWESTGGSAVTGDNSLGAAIREVKEETGFDILPKNGKVLFTVQSDDAICDIWLFQQDFNIEDITFQVNETCDAKWASKDEIRLMVSNGEFIAFDYLEKLFEKVKHEFL